MPPSPNSSGVPKVDSRFRGNDEAGFREKDALSRCYSTVTLLARLRGWSTSVPRWTAMW